MCRYFHDRFTLKSNAIIPEFREKISDNLFTGALQTTLIVGKEKKLYLIGGKDSGGIKTGYLTRHIYKVRNVAVFRKFRHIFGPPKFRPSF